MICGDSDGGGGGGGDDLSFLSSSQIHCDCEDTGEQYYTVIINRFFFK